MTIEELKEHCVRQITGFERIKEIIPVTPNGYKHYEELKIVLQLIEAWKKVKEEIKYHADNIRYTDAYRDGFEVSLKIIDKHLAEVESEE